MAGPSPQHRPLRDPDTPRYVISVAAELVGIHPQTLRAYEKTGLVRPARSPGGGRRYSDADLERLVRITELTRLGLPHVGIKLVLDLEDELRRLRRTTTGTRLGEPGRMTRRISR